MGGERRDPAGTILIGKVVGVFGIKGWVKLQSHTDPREALFDYLPWILRHRGIERQIDKIEGRAQGRGLVASFPGIDTRDAAEGLVGAEILVQRAVLPKPRPGEYYWVDLEGLAVQTVEGQPLGRVSHLFPTGANDVLVVVDGEHERLVPFLMDDVIKRVDFDAGLIVVDWDPDF
jgi:16S rRNA processing protein RimM